MGPQIGKLVEHVTNTGKLVYARIVGINDGLYTCQTPRGKILQLERRDFRVVKCKAGSSLESFNRIFKG